MGTEFSSERRSGAPRVENYLDSLHSYIARNLPELVHERLPTLETIDSRLAEISPRDRDRFRERFMPISGTEQEEILDKLVDLTNEIILDNVRKKWEHFVLSGQMEEVFHDTVIDFLLHSGRATSRRRTWTKNGRHYTTVISDEPFGKAEMVVSTAWSVYSPDLVSRVGVDVDVSEFHSAVIVFRSGIEGPTEILSRVIVETFDRLCEVEAKHIFDAIGVGWIWI